MPPGIVANDGVDLQHPEQEYQPAPELLYADVIHPMVTVSQIIDFWQTQGLRHLEIVCFVVKYDFTEGVATSGVIIIAGAYQVPGIPFLDEFGYCPSREDGYIIIMWLNCRQHFSSMRLPGLIFFYYHFRWIIDGLAGGKRWRCYT